MTKLALLVERTLDARPLYVCAAFAALGATLTLSFAPFDLALLAPLLMLPVLFTALYSPPRRAARHAFFFGVGLFLGGTYWIYVSVHVFGQAPLWIALFLMFGLVLIMAGYLGATGWAMAWLGGGRPWRLALAAPAVWVLIEWLRGWLASGFPWLSLGYTQIDTPLAGWAPVIGVYGVSWMLLVSASGMVTLIAQRNARVAGTALTLLPWLLGYALQAESWAEPSGPPIHTTIVQGGVSQDRKWAPEQFVPTLNLYRNATLAADTSLLIVWPEVAIPASIDRVEAYIDLLQSDLRERRKTLALGILELHDNGRQYYNSVLLLDGERRQTYRKRHLVPFGEFFPVPEFVRDWMRLMSLPNNDMQAGAAEQPLLMTADGTRLAAAICYEDAYGAEQLYALPDAAVLINVSNDAWFGESIAPHQHLQIARMRALEAGRWVVRATNNGISAFIGPDGALVDTAPQFEFATLATAVEPLSGLTPYARGGNWPLIGLLALVVAGSSWRSGTAARL